MMKVALAISPLGWILAAALTVVPVGASANDLSQDAVPRSYAALMQMKPMEVMHAIDADKKGYVTKDEFMSYFGAVYDKMDRNHDGKVNKEEWLKSVWTSP
jgi:hypothetical protein